MNLKETLEMLNKVIVENSDLIKNEESTKQFLILPFLNGLGFDTYSPKEVTPEFTADFHKKNEKVDYAISLNDQPRIFVEAKSMHSKITKSAPQLSRYFSTFPSVKLGILTNGIEYHFFTDLNNANIMDSKPFFIFNITNYSEEDFEHLIKFSKNVYDEETIKILAESLIYFQAFKAVIKEIFETPSDDFIKFVIKERFKFKVTQQFIQASRPLIQKSLQEAISEVISEKFNIDVNQPALEPVLAGHMDSIPIEDKKTYYTAEEINSLNRFEEFDGITIVLPNSKAYQQLCKITPESYAVEKGNPLSQFFISSVIMQGTTTYGYLVGQYLNNGEDIKLYTVKSNEFAKFLNENPIVKDMGFINARLTSRLNRNSTEPTYFLKSCLHNLSFKDTPQLVSTFEKAGKFFD